MSHADPADWLGFADARQRILAAVAPLPAEPAPLRETLGRVLAEDVVSPIDLPARDNSGMDGFAVRAEDVRGASAAAPRTLRVVDDVPAGRFPRCAVGPGEAIRVMTGAPVPAGADGVIRVEHTDGGTAIGTPEGRVRILADTDAGRNVRPQGEDVRRGAAVLRAGVVIGAAAFGVAASVGRAELRVVRRPRVAVLASGDELVELERFDEVLAGRRIVSSNSYALAAQLRAWGMEPVPLGIAADTPESVRAHVLAAAGCDALVTSAGVSVGEHDHLRAVLRSLGAEILFWRVRMRPGSAFAFGRVGALHGIPWFGLPGNPVSTLVVAELLVRPALLRMAGHCALFRPCVAARLEAPALAKVGMTHFLRATVREAEAEWVALPATSQGSGVLSALATSNALLVVPEERPGWQAGETAPALLLDGAPLRAEPPC